MTIVVSACVVEFFEEIKNAMSFAIGRYNNHNLRELYRFSLQPKGEAGT
jgi:hypothetical protein